jgi:hypothetical protein
LKGHKIISQCSRADKEQETLERDEARQQTSTESHEKGSTEVHVAGPTVPQQARETLQKDLPEAERSVPGLQLRVLATFAGLAGLERALKQVEFSLS